MKSEPRRREQHRADRQLSAAAQHAGGREHDRGPIEVTDCTDCDFTDCTDCADCVD